MANPGLIQAAKNYVLRGMSVIPFRSDKNGSCLRSWKYYQENKPTNEELELWFSKKYSDAYIAIITGRISGITVVDCDSEEAYQEVQQYLPENFITPICKSPRGYHIYFLYHHGFNSRQYHTKIDVKTDGGCIIAPPSRNGHSEYQWIHGLSLTTVQPSPMPDALIQYLLSNSHGNSVGLIITSNSNDRANDKNASTNVYKIHNCLQYFTEGRRDQDLFHVANCLSKGKCEKELIDTVLNILAKNCTPPFPENEVAAKVQSAMARQAGRERNLASEVKEWVLSTNGYFLSTNVHNDLQLSTRDEKKNVSIILKRLQDEGIIEKEGKRNGEWRLIDQECKPVDWINASCEYKPLWLPLGLGEICGVQPGNILVFAGAKDSGKTAFLMNVAKENRYRYNVHYFNSEMGKQEFNLRARKFDDITLEQWNSVKLYERTDNFADVVKPGEGNLNIIDFIEVVDEFWKVAATIQKIHKKLNGAICVAAIQKNPKADLGRGGAFSLEKARLYLSLDYQHAKIISCKNYKENDLIRGNPRGYTCQYKLVNGCKIIKQPPGWASETKKGE